MLYIDYQSIYNTSRILDERKLKIEGNALFNTIQFVKRFFMPKMIISKFTEAN